MLCCIPVGTFEIVNFPIQLMSLKFHMYQIHFVHIAFCFFLFLNTYNPSQNVWDEGLGAGLEIISGESPDMMTSQIHFSSVMYRFSLVKFITFIYLIYFIFSTIECDRST